jgi:ABC-type uncharacterized transport system involved in gliding motility auxiliary subunit
MAKKLTTSSRKNAILWTSSIVLAIASLFARAVYPEYLWLTIVLLLLFATALTFLLVENKKALMGRTAAYGANSAITVLLVVAIVGVLNFVSSKYPHKFDLTKNKTHTLSDQTDKLIKGLQKPVKATLFAKFNQQQQDRPLLDNYHALNPKFEVEYVDPDREPTRVKEAGIKKYGQLQLQVGTRESKIDEVTEEKLTNGLVKLLKDKVPTLCTSIGHGEKSFSSNEAEGYSQIKKFLIDESYDQQDFSLAQEGKVPEKCDAVAIVGANKDFMEGEIKALRDYLANGGRMVVGLDMNIKGSNDVAPQLTALLAEWNVKSAPTLIVDPFSKAAGVDAAIPILRNFSKDNVITKDVQGMVLFPFSRPVDAGTSDTTNPAKAQWLVMTTPESWAVSDMSTLKGAIEFRPGKDRKGPMSVAVAVNGKQKDSKAPRETRLVVFGSSQFATNNYSRFAGNLDFFMNSLAWVLEDESSISIRAKEEGPGKIEMSQKQAVFIGILTVILIPLMIAIAGVVIWVVRKRL